MAKKHDSELVANWLKRVHLNCLEDGGCLIWQGRVGNANMPAGRNAEGRNGSMRRHVYKASGRNPMSNYSITMKCGNPKCLDPNHMTMKLRKDILKENYANMNPAAVAKRTKINRERNGVLGFDRAEYVRNSNETLEALAEKFSVGKETIRQARLGVTWVKKEGNPFAGLIK